MTTNLAAAAATLMALIVTWVRYGKPDVSMTFNGSLAGLVAITAGCDAVSNWSAIIIGAISVHGVCGATGTILTGVFSPDYTFGTQLLGVAATAAYVFVLAIIIFTIIDKTIGLRVSKEEEIDGLDVHEHGCSAYADFNFRI